MERITCSISFHICSIKSAELWHEKGRSGSPSRDSSTRSLAMINAPNEYHSTFSEIITLNIGSSNM